MIHKIIYSLHNCSRKIKKSFSYSKVSLKYLKTKIYLEKKKNTSNYKIIPNNIIKNLLFELFNK